MKEKCTASLCDACELCAPLNVTTPPSSEYLPPRTHTHKYTKVLFSKEWPLFLASTGFLCDSAGKESACNVGDLGLIPGLGRSPRGGHGNPHQCFCLENLMDGDDPGELQSIGS